jgi:threonine dehydrogenase-like Zn-dependent dehydrogenase
MPPRCRAAVFDGQGNWEIREFDVPSAPPSGGAILRVEAVGMCHSDVDMLYGVTHTRHPKFPAVPGHETVGRIALISDETAIAWGVNVGDRVAINSSVKRGGDYLSYGHDFSADEAEGLFGGYGEYMVLLPETQVFRLRDDLPAELLTFFNPLAGGIGWTRWVRPGDVVVIQGPGHMGLASVIAAKLAGAATIVVAGKATDEQRLEVATKIGADLAVNVDQSDLVEAVREIAQGELANFVLDAATGGVETVSRCFDIVRRGGTVVLGGLKNRKALEGFVPDRIVLGQLTIHGAVGGMTRESVDLINADKVPLAEVSGEAYGLEELGTAMSLLERKLPGKDAVRVSLKM